VTTALAFYRSLSLLQLILLGFSLIALSLTFVLITSLVAIDRLSSSGQQAAVEAFHRIQAARTLVEEVTAMERNARQYRVLGDPTIFDAYVERRQGFLTALGTLLHSDGVPRDQIDSLTELERGIFQRVRDEPAGPRQCPRRWRISRYLDGSRAAPCRTACAVWPRRSS
jgi:two-component system, NtrC family, sensor histidine kinase GlrK